MLTNKILRTRDVLQLLNIGRSTLYRWLENPEFPRPISLGPNSVGWHASELDAWIESRARVSRQEAV